MTRCRFVATDQPRLLDDRHLRDCNTSGCPGCQPCTEPHCLECGFRHLREGEDRTCGRCVGVTRQDIGEILRMCGVPMQVEALHRGVASEAAMLVGPIAQHAEHAARQRLLVNAALAADDEHGPEQRALLAWMEDNRDEQHPLWVLGTWESLWREHLGHDTDAAVTIGLAADYLLTQLTYMAQQEEPDFSQFVGEVRRCRGHLEDVLRDGVRPETGTRCPLCGEADLVKDYGDTEAEDRWACPRKTCSASYTEEDYRAKVEAVYVREADRLTAGQIREVYRVPEGTTRRWANGWFDGRGVWHDPVVRKCGYDGRRRQLYDVNDVKAQRSIPDPERAVS